MSKTSTLPSGWKTKELRKIANKCTAKNRDFEYSLVLTNSAQHGVIRQSDHFDKDIAVDENINGYYIIRDGEFVYNPRISASAPCGPIRRNHLGLTGVMSPLYTVFSIDKSKVDDKYAEYYFLSAAWHNYAKSIANYGARHDRMAISDNDFFSMPIPLPPLAEQRAIADILETQDRIIALRSRKLGCLEKQKTFFLQKMFPKEGETVPKIRFPEFTDAWEQRRLEELTDVLSAARVHKEEWTSSGVPFFRSSDVVSAYKGTDNEKAFISVELFERLSKTSGRPEKDDIFLTGGGSIGIPYKVPNNKPLYSKDADLLWVKHSLKFDSQYLYTFFETPCFRNYLRSISHIGTIAHYTIEQVKDTPVYLPEIDEQKKLGELFISFDRQLTLHQRELEQEKLVKKYLMQQLLTGKKRVKEASMA